MAIIRTHILGYPRIGNYRELKCALENYWKARCNRNLLECIGRGIRFQFWKKQKQLVMDFIICNYFSFYDQVLDISCMLGNISSNLLQYYFNVARGIQAAELTKWFDTNYHYIVPEFNKITQFNLSSTKVFDEYKEANPLGIQVKPILLGPVTYLLLGKSRDKYLYHLSLLPSLLEVYEHIINKLGSKWVQIDEPILSLDLSKEELTAFNSSYDKLNSLLKAPKIILATYFGPFKINLQKTLKIAAINIDAVRGNNEYSTLLSTFPKEKILSIGVIDGSNIWSNNYYQSLALIQRAKIALDCVLDRLWISTTCSLLHVPVSIKKENKLIKPWLAFAEEKLIELKVLGHIASG